MTDANAPADLLQALADAQRAIAAESPLPPAQRQLVADALAAWLGGERIDDWLAPPRRGKRSPRTVARMNERDELLRALAARVDAPTTRARALVVRQVLDGSSEPPDAAAAALRARLSAHECELSVRQLVRIVNVHRSV